MKLFKIIALTLCLNVSITHANEDAVQFCQTLFKASVYGGLGSTAAMGLGMTVLGMRRIGSAIYAPISTPLLATTTGLDSSVNRSQISSGLDLIFIGTTITTSSLASMVLSQTIGNTCENWGSNDSSGQ